MERAPQGILWFAFIQLFLLGNAKMDGMKLTTNDAHPDFISIDCGASNAYTDPQTGITYQTDMGFIETGTNSLVSPDKRYSVDYLYFGRQLQTLRSFPEGKRNCYTLKPKQGKNNNYLLRAFFSYGNYDGKNQTPTFGLYLGVNHWKEIYPYARLKLAEIIHTPTTDTIDICLVRTGQGIPFISTLELRLLSNSIYITPSPSQSLLIFDARIDVGYSNSTTSNVFSRYMDDIYDRVWRYDEVPQREDWIPFNKSVNIDVAGSTNDSYKLPAQVLRSASQSLNHSFALNFDTVSDWGGTFEKSFNFYVYFHFAEIEQLHPGQKRVISVTLNDEIITKEPVTLEYLKPQTVAAVTNQSGIRFSIRATSESDAPPILNALEIYKFITPLTSPTDQIDVDAILDIKKMYKVFKVDWQGDPCVPKEYTWEGLNCTYAINDSDARITSLNLSMSKLTGNIATPFLQLTELESLDLSGNDLSGSIPEFLAELRKLKVLNLNSNKLSGPIPKALKDKPDLEMSIDDNPGLCLRDPCRKQKFVIPLIVSVSALTVIILVCLGIWIFKMKKMKANSSVLTKQEASEYLRNHVFSYSEVLEITNNLENLIGQGGFGKVYAGTLKNNTQVAVKLLSQSSMQGHRAFRSEVEVLMVVHHRHLVSLIGYCEENGAKALIYEYMANGDLHQHLMGKNASALKWKDRLQIALDAAHGLDYLHNGCKLAIVHRDLKASNILLDKNMEAKIADFGLSRVFANDIDSHVSTCPAGTFGYLDPEFQTSGNLTKGSDIYSFGIILLELITGKPAAKRQPNNTFGLLLQWVTLKLGSKDIQSIIDPVLQEQYSADSAQKFLEIAISCTAPAAIKRPDMSQVVVELRECLAMEISLERTSHNTNSSSSVDMMSTSKFDSDYSTPSAR